MPVTCKVNHDGARNALIDIVGVVDECDLKPTVVVDIAKLYAEPGYKITNVRIDDIQYFVEPGLFVELLWEGDQDHMHCLKVTGRGNANYDKLGGRQNPHDSGTGNIMIATEGHKDGTRQTFTVQLELVKQFN
jgi:hypothetical protein